MRVIAIQTPVPSKMPIPISPYGMSYAGGPKKTRGASPPQQKERAMLCGFEHVQFPCRCFGPQPEGCVCGDDERVLRAYAGGVEAMPPMTATQRGSCLCEAVRCVEGSHRSDFAALS